MTKKKKIKKIRHTQSVKDGWTPDSHSNSRVVPEARIWIKEEYVPLMVKWALKHNQFLRLSNLEPAPAMYLGTRGMWLEGSKFTCSIFEFVAQTGWTLTKGYAGMDTTEFLDRIFGVED